VWARAALAALIACHFAGVPSASGRPALIHAAVLATGLAPTSKYMPSSCGLNLLPPPAFAASESGGKSTTNPRPFTPSTGLPPIPKPALVSACASALAASASALNVCCDAFVGSHALCDVGDITLSPSRKFNDMPERFSSISSGRQPNLNRTIAISFARFWASGSPGITWINIFVPAHCWNPANHFFAGGSWSNPISPTCLGNITVCSARLSAFRCSVSLFSLAADSLAFAASPFAVSPIATLAAIFSDASVLYRSSCCSVAAFESRAAG
jgi:hypothetical protein